MSEDPIYKEIILGHARNPKGRLAMPNPTVRQVGQNPLCGDHIILYLKFRDDSADRKNEENERTEGNSQEKLSTYKCTDQFTNQFTNRCTDLCADKNRTLDICHEGYGCAITVASASILASTLVGKSSELVKKVCSDVLQAFENSEQKAPEVESPELQALISIRQRPARKKCATLPWLALKSALVSLESGKASEAVTTE